MDPIEKFTPQYSPSLVEQLVEFITNSVISGRFSGGLRLSENELQRKFGISRGPIRESFRILERNGLVITVPRKGTFVKKITEKDVKDIFPILELLEGLAARLAVSFLNHDDIQRMEALLSMMAQAAEKKDFKSYVEYHSKYHEIFICASKNEKLVEFIQNLRHQVIWITSKYLSIENSFEYRLRVHREIIDLFIKKDVDRLEALVCEHIAFGFQQLLKFLASRNEAEMEKFRSIRIL